MTKKKSHTLHVYKVQDPTAGIHRMLWEKLEMLQLKKLLPKSPAESNCILETEPMLLTCEPYGQLCNMILIKLALKQNKTFSAHNSHRWD